MAKGGTRSGGSKLVRLETRQAYLDRMRARQSRALITGRLNTYVGMDYLVHQPLLQLFGCQDLRKCLVLG